MKSDEALEQIKYLKEITAKTRIVAANGYPYFILWGIIVTAGHLGSYYMSAHLVWLFVTAIGAVISVFIGLRQKYRFNRLLKEIGIQSSILVITGLLIFLYLFRYEDPILINAFPCFQFAVIYLVASVHMGWDLALVGIWLFISSVISLLLSIPVQDIWLAISNGGGLIFTGILFRTQIRKNGLRI